MSKLNNVSTGIFLYKNAIQKEDNIPKRIENFILNNKNRDKDLLPDDWKLALVRNQEYVPEKRDCFDFKISKMLIDLLPDNEYEDIKSIYYLVHDAIQKNLAEYCKEYKIEDILYPKMEFMEAINFVKYKKGQHFGIHPDHGHTYTCTISSVMYLNDDYEGGELWFPFFDLLIKPEIGDIVFFPSTYLYAHTSLPIVSGTKYSAVTMFDYQESPPEHKLYNIKNSKNRKILQY